jgi:hypothetical protein
MKALNEEFPLVTSCLARDLLVPSATNNRNVSASLSSRLLYESYALGLESSPEKAPATYDTTMDVLSSSVAHLCKVAQGQHKGGAAHLPAEPVRRFIANQAVTQLTKGMSVAPVLTENNIEALSRVVDGVEQVVDPTKKTTISERASLRAQKQSTEKRATTTLLALRDICIKRTSMESREQAVRTVVAIATGSVFAPASVGDKAIK